MTPSGTVGRNTFSTLLISITSRIAKVAGFFAIALMLPTTAVGLYSLALATVEIVSGLSEFGVDMVVIRRLALNFEDCGRVLASSMAAKLLLSMVAYALAVGGGWALGFSKQSILLSGIAGISLFARALTNSLLSPLRARLRMSQVVVINLGSAAFYLGALAAILAVSHSVALLIAVVVATDLLLLLLTFVFTKSIAVPAWPAHWHDVQKLLVEASPLGLAAIFIAAYFRVDAVILEKIVGIKAVGFYSVAYRSTESLLLVAIAYGSSLYPIFSIAAHRDPKELAVPFRQSYNAVVSGMSLIALVTSVYIKPLISCVAPRYLPSALPIAILIWSTLFMFADNITWVAVNSLGRHSVFIRITSVNLAVNLGLNIFLIPKWHIVGAAVATVATEGVNLMQQSLTLRQIVSLRVHSVWLLAVAAGLGAFFVVTFLNRSVIVLCLVALALILVSRSRGYYRGILLSLSPAPAFERKGSTRST